MVLVSLTSLVRGGWGVVVYIFIGSILLHDHILREIAGGLIILVGISYGLFPLSSSVLVSGMTTSRDLAANAIWWETKSVWNMSRLSSPRRI